jgi:hypothetical protein
MAGQLFQAEQIPAQRWLILRGITQFHLPSYSLQQGIQPDPFSAPSVNNNSYLNTLKSDLLQLRAPILALAGLAMLCFFGRSGSSRSYRIRNTRKSLRADEAILHRVGGPIVLGVERNAPT